MSLQRLNKEIKAHEVTEDALKLAQWKLSEKEGQLVARNQEIKNLESKLLERKEECQGLLAMRAELVSKTKTHQKVMGFNYPQKTCGFEMTLLTCLSCQKTYFNFLTSEPVQIF